MDALEAQVEAAEEDGNSLLLEPRKDNVQREVPDLAVEGRGERVGDHHSRVSVVALAHIEDAGDASVANRASVEVVEAVLAAAEGEDDGGLGEVLDELGVVRARALEAVAAADEEEAGDLAALDRVKELGGDRLNRLVAKANGEVVGALLTRGVGVRELLVGGGKAGRGHRGVEEGGIVDVGHGIANVGDILPPDGAGGEEAAAVGLLRLCEAVGGHEDGAGELWELNRLAHPRSSIVANEGLVLLEVGVGVGGEHLAVGVDVDAQAVRLLEEALQHDEVVAGDEDSLAGDGLDGDLRGGGHAERLVAVVQKGHGGDVGLAGLEGKRKGLGEVEAVGAGHEGERAVHVLVNSRILLTIHQRVVGVGRDALEAVDEHLRNSGARLGRGVRETAEDADLPAKLDELIAVGGERDGQVDAEGLLGLGNALAAARGNVLILQLDDVGRGLAEDVDEAGLVKVHVCESREEGIKREAVDLVGNGLAKAAEGVGVEADNLRGVHGEILQRGDAGRLTADTNLVAALAAKGLLTLEAEHISGAHAAEEGRGIDGAGAVDLQEVLHVLISGEVLLVVAASGAEGGRVDAVLLEGRLHLEGNGAAEATIRELALGAQEVHNRAVELVHRGDVLAAAVVAGDVADVEEALGDELAELLLEKLVLAELAEAVEEANLTNLLAAGLGDPAAVEEGAGGADARA